MYNLGVITRFSHWLARIYHCLGLLLLVSLAGCVAVPPADPHPAADVVVAVPAGSEAEALNAAAAAYQQESGVRVRVEVSGVDVYQDMLDGILLAGRADYDLVYLPASRLPRWVNYHALLPLSGQAAAASSPTADNVQIGLALQSWQMMLTHSNLLYGFPTQPAVEALWYRADLLAAAGLQPPSTWEAFRAAALALTAAPDRYGLALAAGENSPGIEFGAVLAGFGGQLFRPLDGDLTIVELTLERPEAQQALAFYASLWAGQALAAPQSLVAGRAEAVSALQAGRAAMAILPLTAVPALFACQTDAENSPADCAENRWAFAPLPGLPVGQAVGELGAWVIPLHAAHPQDAQAFGAWLVGPVGARVWALNGGIPAVDGLLADPQVAAKAPYLAVLTGVLDYRLPYPPVSTGEQVETALHAGVQAAVSGRLDTATAIVEIAAELKRALHQGGYSVR